MFLAERLFKPLNMPDSGFVVANEKAGQIAQQLLPSALTLFDPTITPANDLGGEGGLSTAMDYLRFSEMLLERGKLGGTRALSPTTIALMTSDHLGDWPSSRWGPANYCSACPVTRSGSASRSARAQASLGCQARRANTSWGGIAGTFFWIDPKEELAVVFMSQGPLAARVVCRRLVKQLVYASIVDLTERPGTHPAKPLPSWSRVLTATQ